MGLLDSVIEGTAGAPWIWWAVTLIILIGLLLLGLKFLGLLPE